MTAAYDLAADPLEFMKKNIVIIHGLNPSESNWQATTNFSLLDADTAFGMDIPGFRKSGLLTKTAGVYSLQPYNNNPDTLVTAYWCGYKDDSVKVQMLSDQVSLFFTHRMDGCTFGVGSSTPTGDILVGHFNIQLNGRTDEKIMRESAKIMLGKHCTLLEKSRYLKGNNMALTTTFGFRKNNRWRFYHQRYISKGFGYELLDVRSI